jgi:hypothetical protein
MMTFLKLASLKLKKVKKRIHFKLALWKVNFIIMSGSQMTHRGGEPWTLPAGARREEEREQPLVCRVVP